MTVFFGRFDLVNINSYLIVLLPFTLITGPFLSDLSIVIIGVSFLILISKEKNFKFFKNYFFYIFLIFYIYINFVTFITNPNIDSIRISMSYIRFILFTLGVWYFLEKNETILKKLFFSFLLSFSILIIDGYIQYFFGKNIIGYEISTGPRISSFFDKELILGSYISRLFPIFYGLAIFFVKDIKKLSFISIIFIFAETLVFLSGERASFFYINLSAIYVLILIQKYKLLRLTTLAFSIFIIFLLISTNENTKSRIIDLTLEQTGICSTSKICGNKENVNQKVEIYFFSPIHESIYISAYKMFLDNKIIGIGVKNFKNLCNFERYKVSKFSCSTHPHNTYLQVLTELGLVGFTMLTCIFFTFIFFSIKQLFCLLKNKPYFNDLEVCLLSSILITLWPIIPTGNFFNNWLSIIFYFPLGIFLWSFTNNINNNKKLS